MTEERRSNAQDAAYVEMPACKWCGAANAPGASPVIEHIPPAYLCAVCGRVFTIPNLPRE